MKRENVCFPARPREGRSPTVAQLRKAYKRPRPDRFCPRCGKRTEVNADSVAQCLCGWHAGVTLALPPKPVIVNPAKELAAK